MLKCGHVFPPGPPLGPPVNGGKVSLPVDGEGWGGVSSFVTAFGKRCTKCSVSQLRSRVRGGPDQWRSDGIVGAGLALPEGAASGAPTFGVCPLVALTCLGAVFRTLVGQASRLSFWTGRMPVPLLPAVNDRHGGRSLPVIGLVAW